MKVISLEKVVWAEFYWSNRENNDHRRTKPKYPTISGLEIREDTYAYPHHDYPNETLIERAKRLDILDVWTATLRLRTFSREIVTYYGDRAISIYAKWNEMQFKKKGT